MTAALAERLDRAARTASPLTEPTALTLEEALAVQQTLLRSRAERGDAPIGVKLAFTNPALMRKLGVAEPALGGLTPSMRIDDGTTVALSRFIRPRIESELIVMLQRDLPAGASRAAARDAIAAVAPALEIIDSRFAARPFALPEIVADNASAAAFVVGGWCEPRELDDLAVELRCDGVPVARGTTSAILGHPLDALIAAADLAQRTGRSLCSGMLVLLGSATDPYAPPGPCALSATVERLGPVSVVLSAA